MPECRDGKPRPEVTCPNCGLKGEVRQTSLFLQCCGHTEKITQKGGPREVEGEIWVSAGCGYGGFEDKWPIARQGVLSD